MKYTCLSAESVKLMAEAACFKEPSMEVANIISEDVTCKLRLIVSRAIKFMQHSNRNKLTCKDINRALKWSSCQPAFGYETNPNKDLEYRYSIDAQVFRYKEEEVDLVQKYGNNSTRYRPADISNRQEAIPKLKIEDATQN